MTLNEKFDRIEEIKSLIKQYEILGMDIFESKIQELEYELHALERNNKTEF